MYTLNDELEIIKEERKAFRNLKKIENKHRTIPISEDILYLSEFDLEPFSNKGDSGELYLATRKTNKKEKYILKHEYYDCACNEYMYSKMGNKMGINIAPVKLFVVDDKPDKVKSDFVCGIKYFENSELISFTKVLKSKNEIKNWQDYIKIFCLESLFEETDGIEVIKYQNKIYRIDTTASFTISDFYIHPLAYNYNKNGINIREYAEKTILEFANRRFEYRKGKWESYLNYFIRDFGTQYKNDYLETFNLLKNLTEKDMEEWTNILTWLYPNIIGEYFKKYIENLKMDVEQFLKTKELITA